MEGGTAAFLDDAQVSCKSVMLYGQPYVNWGFSVPRLEDWLTTMEEMMEADAFGVHRASMESLYYCLKAAHAQHLIEHAQVLTEAPSEDDLVAYLTAYSSAIASSYA